MTSRLFHIFFGLLLLIYFVVTATVQPKRTVTSTVSNAYMLPLPLELSLHLGDPNLLANITMIRTSVFPLDFSAKELADRAIFAKRISLLNPRNEDNMFVSNAALPWEGDVNSAQYVIKRAIESRSWDATPSFMYGLNELYFNSDVESAASHVVNASFIETGPNKQYFERLGNFLKEAPDPKPIAIAYLNLIAKYMSNDQVKALLMKRALRLERIVELESLLFEYHESVNEWPKNLDQLKLFSAQSVSEQIFEDPLGGYFSISDKGNIEVVE